MVPDVRVACIGKLMVCARAQNNLMLASIRGVAKRGFTYIFA